MKKVVVLLLVFVMVSMAILPAMAHPAVPEQSLGRVSINAGRGLGNAYHGSGNIAERGGVSKHVFEARFKPVFH